MKIWKRVEPQKAIGVHQAAADSYTCSMKVYAWENHADESIEKQELVAIVYGLVKSGKAEIRVQYEQADYEANKSNLLVQRAVKEAMRTIQNHLTEYLYGQ